MLLLNILDAFFHTFFKHRRYYNVFMHIYALLKVKIIQS